MKWFKRIEFLGIIALWSPALIPGPDLSQINGIDAIGKVIWIMTFAALCWIPLSFLIHLVQEGLNLRRWIWLSALIAEILALTLMTPLNLPDIVIPIAYAGIAAAPFLYILICISETWMPWLNRPRLRAFITDLDL